MHKTANALLAGIKVLDLSAYIAGPSACALLADMGAAVIKVEPPGGDALRHYPSTLPAAGRAFVGVNRSKRGIALDLKAARGLEVLHRLVAGADVLVHNFRPAVPARLGIDYPALKRVKPDLIYCALSGYGESGPLAQRAGFDQVLQCISGIASAQGLERGEPELQQGSVVDFYAGALLAGAISAALYHRERCGEGQALGISLLGAALAMQATRLVWAESEPRDIERDLRSGGVTGIHPCAQASHIYISASTQRFWTNLCRLVGEPDLAANPDYDTLRKRFERTQEIVPVLRAALKKHTAKEWEVIFGEEVPNGAVRAVGEMFDSPQVLDQGYIAQMHHAEAGAYRGFARPFHFGAAGDGEAFAAPALGQDNEAILSELGYDPGEIAALRRSGAVP